MTTEASPSHLSIGEVLNSLRDEFPDITISKIRFLESQGLIDPERTPSGYRKFYDTDISRLRWILYQQKEHFLPLRVIKERLEAEPGDAVPGDAVPGDAVPGDAVPGDAEADDLAPTPEATPGAPMESEPRSNGADPTDPDVADGGDSDVTVMPFRRPETPALPIDDVGSEEGEGEGDGDAGDRPVTSTARMGASGGMSLTRAELAKMAGLDARQVAELESYGLLAPTAHTDEDVLFDEEALAVARAAAGFARHGIEARHLRMYKHLAQREADLFQQVLLPYVRQRNPQARAKAQTDLAELAKLGRALRSALLVSAVREALSD